MRAKTRGLNCEVIVDELVDGAKNMLFSPGEDRAKMRATGGEMPNNLSLNETDSKFTTPDSQKINDGAKVRHKEG